jgi:hypothetical protein
MSKSIKQIWVDIKQGENIDLYLTVIVALVLACLNVFGIGQSMIGSITLAVLALLAFSSLVNRRKLEETAERISCNQDILLEKFPEDRQEYIKGAKELWLIGLVLNKTINDNDSLLRKKLEQGDRIKVLIVNPDSPYVALISKRKFNSDSPADIQNYQKLILSKLCRLKKISPQNIEIRTTNYPPFFGVTAMDLGSIEGVIYIEHYSYKMADDLPRMVFQQSDTKWFQHYREQIMNIWKDSDEWNCTYSE